LQSDWRIDWNLHTVADMLNYYPRDHIDYARQVAIKDLNDGDTVTIIGTIRRFSCFTSPKNKKFTIVEVLVSDPLAQLS
jgi:ATP-dependent DNA helicase RecG